MCACQFGWPRVAGELLRRGCYIHKAMEVSEVDLFKVDVPTVLGSESRTNM